MEINHIQVFWIIDEKKSYYDDHLKVVRQFSRNWTSFVSLMTWTQRSAYNLILLQSLLHIKLF